MSTRQTGTRGRSRVGILGGMGPMATHAFYEALISHTRASADQDHLDVVIDANPGIPDRTAFILGRGPDPRPALSAAASRLVAAGAELIVMPCNTAQAFRAELERDSGVPFVPWVASAVAAVVAAARPPVAVLATAGTQQADIFGPELDEQRFPYLLPTDEETDTIMDCIYDYKARGRATRASRTALVEVAAALHRRGARSFLLGCTELPLVLPPSSRRWPAPAIDPAVAAARRTIVLAGAELGRP